MNLDVRFLIFPISVALIWVVSVWAADSCDLWFAKTGAKPGNSNCEMECAAADTDMGTFSCPAACPSYCKLRQKCSLDPFWQRVLSGDLAPFKTLSNDEKERVAKALSRLPKGLRPSKLRGIGRSSSPDFLSPANPAMSSGEFIIVFPPAFSTDVPLERTLLHEVVHEMVAKEWAKFFSDYKKSSGWEKASGDAPRPGRFVVNDSRDSADEDFANNIEYFIFAPEKLKSISPDLYSWIKKNLGTMLKLEKGCNDSEKQSN